MSIRNAGISTFCCLLAICFIQQPESVEAQIFGNSDGSGTNSVDLDLLRMIQCEVPDPDNPPGAIICAFLVPRMVDLMVEADQTLDGIFSGYREDMPFFFRNQLDGPVLIECVIDMIDGPGMTLAQAGPNSFAFYLPNPFLRRGQNIRGWTLPRTATITFDVDDLIPLIVSEQLIDVAVHEAFHAMGHPSAFEISGLSGPTNIFGQVNFLGDDTGINDSGYGLVEFRQESGNPFAQFIPLSQTDDAAHLSAFEPTFTRFDEGYQEVFLPTAPPPGIESFMSFSLQGMFADLGYRVRGVNGPGFIDLDRDGIEDEPTVINPIMHDHDD